MANHQQKYDRQLRLWGDHGQARLERASVCLIGATATGSEILKNLVLPGVGAFTILDGAVVSQRDCANNFFVHVDWIGQSRAQAVTQLLCELNPAVRGTHVEEDPSSYILRCDARSFFAKFTVVVVACSLSRKAVLQLDDLLKELRIPLVMTRTAGLFGLLRIVSPNHLVIESKVEKVHEHLRIAQPFPRLEQLFSSADFSAMDDEAHSHVPYIVILGKAMQGYLADHGNAMPSTDAQKQEFRSRYVLPLRRSIDEDNFGDAERLAFHAYVDAKSVARNSDLAAVFSHPDCAFDSSSVLWRAAAAVSQFVSENNVLPLLGRIPDMTSDTASYVALQEAYRAKAKEDAARVRRILQEHDPAMGDLEEKEQQLVDWAIANAVSLRVVHNRTLREELESPANGEIAMGLMMLEMGHHGVLYPCFRAGAEFAEKHGRYPESADQDFTEFRSLVAAECPEGSSVPDEIVLEFCRASNSELQNVAAVLGGVGAQEIIKLVTLQRVPMQNTFIYNGIAGGGSVMKL